mgnify:CR=1 FL=1
MKMYIGQLLIGALFSMICDGGVCFICNDPKYDIPMTEKIITTIGSFIVFFAYLYNCLYIVGFAPQ